MLRKLLYLFLIYLISSSIVFLCLAYKYGLTLESLNKEGLHNLKYKILTDIFIYFGFPVEIPVYIETKIVTPLGVLFMYAVMTGVCVPVFLFLLKYFSGFLPPGGFGL